MSVLVRFVSLWAVRAIMRVLLLLISFSYRLKAKFPLVAQTPASNAYDYYYPDVAGVREAQTLVVQQ